MHTRVHNIHTHTRMHACKYADIFLLGNWGSYRCNFIELPQLVQRIKCPRGPPGLHTPFPTHCCPTSLEVPPHLWVSLWNYEDSGLRLINNSSSFTGSCVASRGPRWDGNHQCMNDLDTVIFSCCSVCFFSLIYIECAPLHLLTLLPFEHQ